MSNTTFCPEWCQKSNRLSPDHCSRSWIEEQLKTTFYHDFTLPSQSQTDLAHIGHDMLVSITTFVQNGVKSQTGYQQITVAEVELNNC